MSSSQLWTSGDIRELFDLEQVSSDKFESIFARKNMSGTVYGGQLVGQSLIAASRTVTDKVIESCYGVFLKAGSISSRIEFDVQRVRDGRTFQNRRVIVRQEDNILFEMLCNFHNPEPGYRRHSELPNCPPPESLKSYSEIVTGAEDQLDPILIQRLTNTVEIEAKPVIERELFQPQPEPRRRLWMRVPSATFDRETKPDLCRATLGYAADFRLASTSLLVQDYPRTQRPFVVSLDLGIQFHRTPSMSDWVLYDMESPFIGNGTAYSRGHVYQQDGEMLATVTQSSLQRLKR